MHVLESTVHACIQLHANTRVTEARAEGNSAIRVKPQFSNHPPTNTLNSTKANHGETPRPISGWTHVSRAERNMPRALLAKPKRQEKRIRTSNEKSTSVSNNSQETASTRKDVSHNSYRSCGRPHAPDVCKRTLVEKHHKEKKQNM